MSDQRIDLLVAEFLDSEHARALSPANPATRRRAALLLISSCFEDLGVDPRQLDGEALRTLYLAILAPKLAPSDELIGLLPPMGRALMAHLGETSLLTHQFEIDLALDEVEEQFHATVASIMPEERVAGRVRTIKSKGEKVGRNDPCPCGSGQKFKKCCGRNG